MDTSSRNPPTEASKLILSPLKFFLFLDLPQIQILQGESRIQPSSCQRHLWAFANLADGQVRPDLAWRELAWMKFMVYGRLPRSTYPTRSFEVFFDPVGMTVSSLAVGELSDAQ
ncbi:hypothetical protein [Saccharomonospora piscinae]|uniref:hypothetical protein n=1 Tax=Saccharomonospora piscinae TaxID=687388 RepID=UPI0012DEA67B|nr:hypothetical protein [Saccharomonospora piscinae]